MHYYKLEGVNKESCCNISLSAQHLPSSSFIRILAFSIALQSDLYGLILSMTWEERGSRKDKLNHVWPNRGNGQSRSWSRKADKKKEHKCTNVVVNKQ